MGEEQSPNTGTAAIVMRVLNVTASNGIAALPPRRFADRGGAKPRADGGRSAAKRRNAARRRS